MRHTLHYPAAALVVTLGIACAAEASDVIRVEEDWELIVRQPKADNGAPQITCSISTESVQASLALNHKTLPVFAPGGLQLQVWVGEQAVSHATSSASGVLRYPNETIRWTTKMSLLEGGLLFEVTNGNSSSFGEFGGEGDLRTSLSCSGASLVGYSPNNSQAKSSVHYAANRVETLVLKEVRYYSSAGLVFRDTTDRFVVRHD